MIGRAVVILGPRIIRMVQKLRVKEVKVLGVTMELMEQQQKINAGTEKRVRSLQKQVSLLFALAKEKSDGNK